MRGAGRRMGTESRRRWTDTLPLKPRIRFGTPNIGAIKKGIAESSNRSPSAIPFSVMSSQHLIHHRHHGLAQRGCLGLSIFQGPALDAVVEFDLRLGAGRSHADPCAVVHIVVQHVGCRKSGGLHLSGLHIPDGVQLVVPCGQYLVAAHLGAINHGISKGK